MPYNVEAPSMQALIHERERHRFTTRSGRYLKSVKTMCKRWVPQFDKDGVAARVAAREGRTVEEVLAEWEKKAERGRAIGNAFHEAVQQFYEHGTQLTALDGEPEVTERFDAWYQHVSPRIEEPALVNGVQAIELPVHHTRFGYAGIYDLLGVTKAGLWLFDWKTNEKFTEENQWGSMLLQELSHLPECDYTTHSVQTTLLWLALESHGVEVAGAAIAWLGPGGAVKLKKALDLREPIRSYLEAA